MGTKKSLEMTVIPSIPRNNVTKKLFPPPLGGTPGEIIANRKSHFIIDQHNLILKLRKKFER